MSITLGFLAEQLRHAPSPAAARAAVREALGTEADPAWPQRCWREYLLSSDMLDADTLGDALRADPNGLVELLAHRTFGMRPDLQQATWRHIARMLIGEEPEWPRLDAALELLVRRRSEADGTLHFTLPAADQAALEGWLLARLAATPFAGTAQAPRVGDGSGATALLLHLPAVAEDVLLRLAQHGPMRDHLPQVLANRPEATPAVWVALLTRFGVGVVGPTINNHRAARQSPAVRERLLANAFFRERYPWQSRALEALAGDPATFGTIVVEIFREQREDIVLRTLYDATPAQLGGLGRAGVRVLTQARSARLREALGGILPLLPPERPARVAGDTR